MTPIAAMVAKMLAVGTPHETIILAVETAESVSCPQNSADISADRRRAKDRERKRLVRRIPQNSADSADTLSLLKEDSSKKESKDSRGTRCPPEWTPSPADFQFARDQGLLPAEIDREAGAFRDFWTAKPGRDGVKLDWSATWRNRIRNYLLRRPNGPSVPPDTAWKLQKAMADTLARRNGSG